MSFKKIILKDVEEVSKYFAQVIMEGVSLSSKEFNIALSGGSTPKLIFKYLADQYDSKIEWNKINFYWGDERCVPPNDDESNFKWANDLLFKPLNIKDENIFRIKGENDPEQESVRYSKVISSNVPQVNSLPWFDLIMLGLGEDGHTASIFPGNLNLFASTKICETAEHPSTKQKRVTITGNVINNAKKIAFIVTGKSKSKIADIILNKKPGYENLPASYVNPEDGDLIWLMDKSATLI